MSDELAGIIESDATVDDLQFFPEVYSHRRFLLQRLAAIGDDVKELDQMLGIGATTLDGLILAVRERLTVQQGHAAILEQAETELHSPFQQAAVDIGATWACRWARAHAVGESCNCDSMHEVRG